MKKEQEKKCVNWFMHKRGKQWIYGCGVLVCGIVLGTVATPVMADEAVSSPMELVTVADVNADNNTNTDQKTEVDQETQQPANQVETPENQTPIEQGVVGEQNQKVTEENQVTENQDVTQQNQVTENQEPATKTQDDAQKTETTDAEEKVEVTDSLKQKADQPNESTEKARKALSTNLTTKKESSYNTNLQGLSYDANVWEVREDGLYSNAIGEGDSFLLSTSAGKNFVFQTDVTFLQNTGAASLVFRSTGDAQNLKGYVVNLDGNSHKIKFMRWGEANLIDEKEIEATSDNKYSLKVVAANGWISYYINGILVANLSDYTIQRDDRGQTTYIKDGNFGLLNWNGEMIFQNTFYRELTDAELPILKDVTVSSKNGPVEPKGQFFPEGAVYIQYVSHDASTVDLSFVPNNQDAVIKVTDDQGNVYSDPSNIPVSVGANYLTVTSTYTVDGYEVTSTYRINVHRRQSAEVYYNENFRDQYHYSVKDGWANDPNGLVYYNGVYHMFYQFYDDIQWGPMHWAHATSTDLIHWEDQPIAFYPDYNGAMFSGCIVADPNNTSGLFEGDKGGLVALITADGEGQRIKVAYSKDEGKTWQKLDEVAADWSTDPLQNRDFRDPKVFRWEGKWFMVLAGGPLRIYSSDNLLDWSVESTYPDLHTECPDLYPIMAEGNTVKWVLSRGGRYYKVGDLKQVDGHWKFVADADYQESDGIMNFGKDSYAAMTYYVQDFGTKDNPTIPQIIELNWMNTWDNYCNLVAERTGQKFNGTFNLNLTLGLVKDGDKYVLTQTPIKAYESLRDVDHKVEYKDVVGKDNNLFKDFSGDTYEIVAHFKPSDRTTKVGFNLRVGQGEVTKVYYDLQTGRIAIDRSQSGIILTELFRNVDSQAVTRNADGSIDLHIFVDRASVEVFTKGGTVTGANQIFTSPQSLGLGVFAEGYEAKADIALYPLKSIWKDKVETTKPQSIVPASAKNVRMNVGDSTVVKAYVSPAVVNQDLLWSILNNGNVSTEISGNQVFVKALKKGQVIVRAQSKTDPSVYQDFVLDILEDNFKTNVKNVKVFAGDWHADGESLKVENHNSNDIYMAADKMPYENYQMDLDIKYGRGVVNIFFASGNPDANNAYSIQFGGDNSVRLFRFYSDTISESQMTAAINDNQFHHVRLVKSANAIQVFVDNQLAMSYTFDQVEDFFNNPYIGLGLWDGELEVQNFFVVDLDAKEPTQNEEKVEVVPTDPQTPAEQVVTTTTLAAKAPAKSEKATDAKAPVIPKTALVSETVLPQTGEKDSHLAGLGIVSILAAMGAFFGQFFKKKES
ncbi:GH32 C-terminal domain-containing protein [Streptococcus gallolyticus]|uniref:GH32 C-terminal domain-containing protein n=1 Tax=Streptococcus gallolyticus TaxID=315405 RepID=UPI003D6F8E03